MLSSVYHEFVLWSFQWVCSFQPSKYEENKNTQTDSSKVLLASNLNQFDCWSLSSFFTKTQQLRHFLPGLKPNTILRKHPIECLQNTMCLHVVSQLTATVWDLMPSKKKEGEKRRRHCVCAEGDFLQGLLIILASAVLLIDPPELPPPESSLPGKK